MAERSEAKIAKRSIATKKTLKKFDKTDKKYLVAVTEPRWR
jgi:hypothetical protein